MSSLTEDTKGTQEFEWNAGLFVGVQYRVTAYGPEETQVWPAIFSIEAGRDRFAAPVPSAAVADKLSELFARMAQQMREAK